MNLETTEYMKRKIREFDSLDSELKTLQKLKTDLKKDTEIKLELKEDINNLIDNRIARVNQQIQEL